MREGKSGIPQLHTDDDFKNYLDQNPQFNLIDDKGISELRIKLGKGHRKESDWDVIKGILSGHNIIVMEPPKHTWRFKVIEHVLCDNGYLMAYTNMPDARKYITEINEQDGVPGRLFQLGVMPFEQIIEIADYHRKDILFDFHSGQNLTLLAYYWDERSLKATIMTKM